MPSFSTVGQLEEITELIGSFKFRLGKYNYEVKGKRPKALKIGHWIKMVYENNTFSFWDIGKSSRAYVEALLPGAKCSAITDEKRNRIRYSVWHNGKLYSSRHTTALRAWNAARKHLNEMKDAFLKE